MVFQGSFNGVSRKFKGCFEKVSRVLQGGFKGVSCKPCCDITKHYVIKWLRKKKLTDCKECKDEVNKKGYLIKHQNQHTQFLGLC